MFERIISAIKAYFLIINMRPEAAGLIKRRSLYKMEGKETPLWIHLLLFVLTLITTTIAGVLTCSKSADLINEIFSSGLPFSLTIITILLAHEMGHYMTARHFGVRATLPYFIPFPSIIGTMGAVIKIKSPIRDKRELLYIGAMGPLVGFILSLTAFVIGLYLSEVKTLMEHGNNKDIYIFGDSIISSVLTRIVHGNIPDGHDIILSPFLWAGWIGFLVTSLNLMPMGQLDGSHILYSLVGEKQLIFGWLTFLGLIALSFIWPGWIIWIIMALLFLMIGHPPIDDGPSLSFKDRVLGWICVLIFIITFIPMPVDIISGAEPDSRIYPIRYEVCSEYLEPSGITIHNNRLLFNGYRLSVQFKKGLGLCRGVYLTKDKIFLLIDSGGERIKGKKYGEHGALVVMKRPAAF